MVRYILLGAFVGSAVGYIIPPGSFFWFILGSIGGYVAGRYIDDRPF